MKVYENKTYQDTIESYISFQKSLGLKVTFQKIAEIMRIQKSYLSKVMARNASLSRDQLFLFAKEVGLDSNQMEYLFLLLDHEKCAVEDYKIHLQKKIDKISSLHTQSDKYINKESIQITDAQMNKYYLNCENQLIHLSFSIPKYQENVEALRVDLRLSAKQFSDALALLKDLGLIQILEGRVKLIKSNLHLQHNSPYFHQWKNQLSLKAMEWEKGLEQNDKYNFTVSFTADDEAKERIRLEFLNMLNFIEKEVTKAPSDNLYQMNFDLFKWL
jgi:transcriptional regulator with XRE-family HTH domain